MHVSFGDFVVSICKGDAHCSHGSGAHHIVHGVLGLITNERECLWHPEHFFGIAAGARLIASMAKWVNGDRGSAEVLKLALPPEHPGDEGLIRRIDRLNPSRLPRWLRTLVEDEPEREWVHGYDFELGWRSNSKDGWYLLLKRPHNPDWVSREVADFEEAHRVFCDGVCSWSSLYFLKPSEAQELWRRFEEAFGPNSQFGSVASHAA